jgi:hypothetical protein
MAAAEPSLSSSSSSVEAIASPLMSSTLAQAWCRWKSVLVICLPDSCICLMYKTSHTVIMTINGRAAHLQVQVCGHIMLQIESTDQMCSGSLAAAGQYEERQRKRGLLNSRWIWSCVTSPSPRQEAGSHATWLNVDWGLWRSFVYEIECNMWATVSCPVNRQQLDYR